ncbi:MAG: N-6 DNA methylase, partial [Spirochaetes bacterium]|nr:N-6 DNA methylase [Spirochaetota bacterium]
ILKPLKTFYISDYDSLYQQAKKINWHKLFNYDRTLRIDAAGSSHILKNSQYTIHRVKDAVLDTIRKFNENKRPDINKDDPDIHIAVHVQGKKATVCLGSSGQPLFKRGYRIEHGIAPIKEDLAAGLILLSGWDRKKDVLDPMCGSGTFLIEAYNIANNIPPNLNRKFSFMNWYDFDEKLYNEVKEYLNKKIKISDVRLYGFEKDKRTYFTANKIIKELNIKNIILENRDFLKTEKTFNNHFIITNPPYGERLKDDNLKNFYKQIGDFLKQKCKGSNASIFTANLEAAKFIGLRTSKKIIIWNGPLEGRLLKFELY